MDGYSNNCTAQKRREATNEDILDHIARGVFEISRDSKSRSPGGHCTEGGVPDARDWRILFNKGITYVK